MRTTECGMDARRTGTFCTCVCLLLAGCTASGKLGWESLTAGDQAQNVEPDQESHRESDSSSPPRGPGEADRQARIMRDVREFLSRVEDAETQASQEPDTRQHNEMNRPATGQADRQARDAQADPRWARSTADRRDGRAGETTQRGARRTQPGDSRDAGHSGVALNAGLAVEEKEASVPAVPVVKSVAIVLPRLPWDEIDAAREVETNPASTKANKPLARTVGLKEDFDLDRYLATLSTHVSESGDVDEAWRLMLAGLTFGRQADIPADALPADAVRMIKEIRELVAASRYLSLHPLQPGNAMLDQVESLSSLVSDYADLEIPVVVLCSEVVMFGVYESLPSYVFEAGRASEAILYIEVENLGATKEDNGLFRSELATRLALMTQSGETIWQHQEDEIVDQCRRRRRDFFIAQRVRIPATLVAGDYVLKIVVEDRVSAKANEAVLPIEVRTPPPVVLQEQGN